LVGNLQLMSGDFSTNNALTLISDINGTARIGEITAGSISDDVTVQRYIPSGVTNWRFLTAPVGGATLLSWNDDFIVSGIPNSWFPNFPFTSIIRYNEPASGNLLDNGYEDPTDITNPINQGQGYWVWCGDALGGTAPFTIDVTGPVYTGVQSLPLDYTPSTGGFENDGWNLIGNPYPAPIDFSSSAVSVSGAEEKYWIYDPQNGTTYCWDRGSGVGSAPAITGLISSSQAFWMHATTGGASLNLSENSKSDSGDDIFRAPASSLPASLRIRLADQNDQFRDYLTLLHDPNASDSLDSGDALKLYNSHPSAPNLAALTADQKAVCINASPLFGGAAEIPLEVTSQQSDLYTFSLQDSATMADFCIILEDRQLGIFTELKDQSYSVFLPISVSSGRFFLHLATPLDITVTDLSCAGEADGQVVVSGGGTGPWDFTWYNDAGLPLGSIAGQSTSLYLDSLSAGQYSLQINGSGFCAQQTQSFVIEEPAGVIASFVPDMDTAFLPTQATFYFANTSQNAGFYEWDLGDGNTSNSPDVLHTYQGSGTYQVQLIAKDPPCADTTKMEVTVMPEVITTGIIAQRESEIKLFADQGQVTAMVKLTAAAEVRLQLFDVTGRLLRDKQVALTEGSIQLSTNGLAHGIHLARLLIDGTERRVIQVIR